MQHLYKHTRAYTIRQAQPIGNNDFCIIGHKDCLQTYIQSRAEFMLSDFKATRFSCKIRKLKQVKVHEDTQISQRFFFMFFKSLLEAGRPTELAVGKRFSIRINCTQMCSCVELDVTLMSNVLQLVILWNSFKNFWELAWFYDDSTMSKVFYAQPACLSLQHLSCWDASKGKDKSGIFNAAMKANLGEPVLAGWTGCKQPASTVAPPVF